VTELKNYISTELAEQLASELRSAWPAFDDERFAAGLGAELRPLELMDRAGLLANRLSELLPHEFGDAASVLWRALESDTFTGWMILPCTRYVSVAGITYPELALPLLAGLTPRLSSEFAVRPFIEHHADVAYAHFRRWASDPDEHVRRLVSEGTRPRLPWASRLRGLMADPSPNIELLDRLAGDPSEYVRRSVANHLNDISKDHPDLAVDIARRWMQQGHTWVVRHGLRSLVKTGDRDALALLGVATDARIRLTDLRIEPGTVTIGDEITLEFVLELDDAAPVEAIVDYRVHYAGANGARRPRVFKLARRTLEPGMPETFNRRHALKPVSIRRIYPGRHTVDIWVNGKVLGSADADVRAAP
jgi:3-methyladenine DNA glycosylase AlkC